MIKILKRNSQVGKTATMREAFNKMKTIMLFVCIGLGTVFAQAQDYNISGTILDDAGLPLPGASIIEKGTQNGSESDFDGNFRIAVANGQATLEVSFVGFTTQEVPVNGQSIISVTLVSDATLDEVVVVGYGTQRKGEVTAAIATVDAATITKQATSSTIDAIKGQVAGVDVVSGGSRPGQDPQVRIRGNRSPSAGNNPLYVIDGIPAGTISDLNPQDIANMQILKDAAATAIYGSRGSNGVILITTKRGRVGKTKVTYSGSFGTTSATRLVDMMDGPQYADLKRESNRDGWNGAIPADSEVFEDPVELESIALGRTEDFLDLVINDGWQTNHQFGVSGGSEKTTFNVSMGYFKEQGIISNQDYERFTSRINLDHRINDIFKVGVSIAVTKSTQNYGSDATMGEALANNPLGRAYDNEGNINLQPTNDGIRTNPLAELVPGAFLDERKSTRVFAPVYLEVNLMEGLKLRSSFGPDMRFGTNGLFTGSQTNANRGGPAKARAENSEDFGWTLENLLTYNREVGDNSNLKLTFLQSIQKFRGEDYSSSVTNIPYETQYWYNLSSGLNPSVDSGLSEWSLSSFMGRVNYEIGGKYLFQASLRADGSSRLAEGNKWYYFPGFSAGWRISEEDFMQDSNVFSDLKLRASYGAVGNTSVSPYQTAGRLTGSVYAFGEESALGFRLNEIPNSDLGWEVSSTFDLGVDFGLFDGRVNGGLDYYMTETTDILLNRLLPLTSGYEDILQNIGATESSGIEFHVNGDILDNEDGLRWNVGFNITSYDEKIVDVALRDADGNITDDIANGWFIGQPLNVFYDYKKIGIWQANEAAEALVMDNKVPGEIKLQDLDGDNVITPADRMVIGSDVPDYYGGITNTFDYKGFDFSFFFYFRQGQTIQSDFQSRNNSLFGRYNNLDTDYWTIDNPTNESPRPNQNQESPRNNSTMRYFDGSYVKLRNVTLGYNFPETVTEKLNMSSLRLTLTGQNLWFITDYETFDPENSGSIGSSDIPSNRLISAGINITF